MPFVHIYGIAHVPPTVRFIGYASMDIDLHSLHDLPVKSTVTRHHYSDGTRKTPNLGSWWLKLDITSSQHAVSHADDSSVFTNRRNANSHLAFASGNVQNSPICA